MSDSPQSSNVIFLKRNSVVPPKERIKQDAADPTHDYWWNLSASCFYEDDGTSPEQAYAEFYERQQQSDVAS